MEKRSIIFHGKRVDNGEWVEGDLIQLDSRIMIADRGMTAYDKGNVHEEISLECVEIAPETVGQFTGLTDKNGTKIFEGDILSVKEFWNAGMPDMTYEDRDLFELNDLKGELNCKYITDIAYEPGCFVIKTGKEDYDCFASVLEGNQKHSQPIFDCEIIGTIHDNPELL